MNEQKFDYGNLYAGNAEVVRTTLTLSKGLNIKRGTVLGRLVNGEVVIADKSRSDLAKTIYCIASEDCDATTSAKSVVVDLTGEFNVRALIFAANNTAAEHERDARGLNIFFKSSIAK